tara:strand:+ start:2494 stop:3342 length:849 start_codon:yes stop_codon:yes gene_type:complete
VAKFRLDRYKPLLALGLFFAVWWIGRPLVQSFLQISFTEFQAPSWVATSHLDGLAGFWARRSHSKVELIEAGKELERENARYQIMRQRYRTLEDELSRLEAMLEMPGRREFRHEIARVIRREQSAWWGRIIVRKGRNYDIRVGAAVVFAGGVVGRVTEVHAYTSEIDLITSPDFRIAAQFEDDPRPVIYQGLPQDGFAKPHGEVRDVPQDLLASSSQPIKLVTTSLGGTFPAGLSIGTVDWLQPGSSGIFQSGAVQLDPRLLQLREVAILVPLEAGTHSHVF